MSALQARRHSSTDRTDVAIVSFDAEDSATDVFGRACRQAGIAFLPRNRSDIEGAPVMLARLFLDRLMPPAYSQFLYIDGDTQVAASLDPLVDAHVADGKFLAANDPMTFALPGRNTHSKAIGDYFHSLGLSSDGTCNYFNTGVLRIARRGWNDIGQRAWQLFRDARDTFRFPDQDALNLAGIAHCTPISVAWNFPIFMLNARVEKLVVPRIIHFMSKPKPWQGPFQPWGRQAQMPYLEALRNHPDMARYHSKMIFRSRVRYHIQQRYKQLLETFTWGMGSNRNHILEYERSLNSL